VTIVSEAAPGGVSSGDSFMPNLAASATHYYFEYFEAHHVGGSEVVAIGRERSSSTRDSAGG
jgi:hypothetical protein